MTEQPQEVPITNDGYARWLRAQRPPWEFFFTLSELEQEQLAMIGEQYVEEVAFTQSLMITHSEQYQTGRGLSHGDADTEASAALRAARSMATNLSASEPAGSSSMAGAGGRMSSDLDFRTAGQPRLFGKEPNP